MEGVSRASLRSPAVDEVRVSSYWLDACEDIGDLVELGGGHDDEGGLAAAGDFFGGIDHILDSFKSGDGLPRPAGVSGAEASNGPAPARAGPAHCSGPAPAKRPRVGDRRQPYQGRERIGGPRKRGRDWDEGDRRFRDCVRRKDHRSGNGTFRRDREPNGYWERDKAGSSEMVFRHGAYEARDPRGGTGSERGGRDFDGKQEGNKAEEAKERAAGPPEEKVRQYQLDVLEQAKQKNTIAFLETGAGKTLIAVLLIKSLNDDLQKQGKKLLSVFLVPKVPLVYQVRVQDLECFWLWMSAC